MKRKLFAAAIGIALLLIPSLAKDVVHNKQVHFDKGTTGATMKGQINRKPAQGWFIHHTGFYYAQCSKKK